MENFTPVFLALVAGFLLGAATIWCARDVDQMLSTSHEPPDTAMDDTTTPPEATGPGTDSYGAASAPPVTHKMDRQIASGLIIASSVLRITQCPDPNMWYAKYVGCYVPWLGTWTDGYKSREPAGFVNIVKIDDAVRVTLTPGERAYYYD